ncbi:hypothetical protein [Saccharothrix yanglingensis]|uniref:hypothetical protein n=1 Tax=Saccharothrix yanglingensis TaxID=659496 RepID=UPI0027D20B54|nr:hypothetical protein [Saccharothrix yanglingensis]
MSAETTQGGMWVAVADDGPITLGVEPEARRAEITFFGSFEVSLSLSERSIFRCQALCAEALREMRAVGDDPERSWMQPAAPSG